MKDEDPRFKNSKFLKFLGHLSNGDAKINSETNELIYTKPELALEKENEILDSSPRPY